MRGAYFLDTCGKKCEKMVMIGTKNICTFVYDMCKDSYLSLDKYVHIPYTTYRYFGIHFFLGSAPHPMMPVDSVVKV